VLFDLDGVLIDTTDLHYRVWDEYARSQGFVPSREQLLATNGRRADEVVRHWLGQELPEDHVVALTADRESYYSRLLAAEPVPAVPGAADFVRELIAAGVPVAVATSAIRKNALLALAKIGLADAFRVIVTATDVTKGKPDPEPYLKAAAALGYPATACLVVEDAVSGIRAAKASGAKCLALATTFAEAQLAAESPDWLVRGYAQIPPELRPTS
jgi:HAD superfamily hydrolase (TIGR01509 family)